MRKNIAYAGIFTAIICLMPADGLTQVEVVKKEGLSVTVDKQESRLLDNSISIWGGRQLAGWVMVPMIPENTPPEAFSQQDVLTTLSEGYFAGAGILNKTSRHFQFGLQAGYYNSKAPVARAGERSTGTWVLENNGGISEFTEVSNKDADRISEAIAIRATARLILPAGPVRIWAGVTGGTYTSTVRFGPRSECNFANCETKTIIAPTVQSGIDLVFKNSSGKDAFGVSLFAEFLGPEIEESFLDTVIEGWSYEPGESNPVMSPVRLGLAISFH